MHAHRHSSSIWKKHFSKINREAVSKYKDLEIEINGMWDMKLLLEPATMDGKQENLART